MSSPNASASLPQNPGLSSPVSPSEHAELSIDEARATIVRMRDDACVAARPLLDGGAAPIRVMARMVQDLEARCRELGIPRELAAREIVNRTIGDIDMRRITARDDGPEFVSLADDMGIALPGEVIDGRVSTGETYRWIRSAMEDFERDLLARHIDLRMYDISGAGNLLLREMIAEWIDQRWRVVLPREQIYVNLGSTDGLGKFWQGFVAHLRQRGGTPAEVGVIFPAPGFNVPEWQAVNLGLRLHRLYTHADDGFKVTPAMLRSALDEAPDVRLFYLTVSSNPTAFAYTPEELRALCEVVRGRDVLIVADLAYIGTGDPADDRARMQAFTTPGVLEQSVLCGTFSKSHTLTGDRFGWVGFGSAQLAASVSPGWTNTTAALPADWQLRYMACVRLFAERPELDDRVRALYRLRRERLVRQLRALDEQHGLFAHINLDDGGTLYNWSQLHPGEDVFSLFSKTGIAGVPGGAFGYSDDFVRLSVGCIPVPEQV